MRRKIVAFDLTGCLHIGILRFVIRWLVRDTNPTVLYGMCREIRILVYLRLLCTGQEPPKVVPKRGGVTDFAGADMRHFVDSDEGDDIFIH